MEGMAVVEVEEEEVVVGGRVVRRRTAGRFGRVSRGPPVVVVVSAGAVVVVMEGSSPPLPPRHSRGPNVATLVASRPSASRTHGCATTGRLQTAQEFIRRKLKEREGGGGSGIERKERKRFFSD